MFGKSARQPTVAGVRMQVVPVYRHGLRAVVGVLGQVGRIACVVREGHRASD